MDKDAVPVGRDEWLFGHPGRISVAKRIGAGGLVRILAYSDNAHDGERLREMARDEGAYIIKNISERDVLYVD